MTNVTETALTEHTAASQFVSWFRDSSPYINAHRGRTFVVMLGGEAVADARFPHMVHDLALLNSLGVRLVLVHGARPQVQQRLAAAGVEMRFAHGLRVTGDDALPCVKEAVGRVRIDIEALLSMGLANSPMAGARIRVANGNFVTARPLGVREGVDFRYTGEVRRIDTDGIKRQLDEGAIVLLSPLGYSPTGEVFNLSAEDVATSAAIYLKAEKLICLTETAGVLDEHGELWRQMTLAEAEQCMAATSDAETAQHLRSALRACRAGVRRAHLISRHTDGALLLELFTRNGVGTLVTSDRFDHTRRATIDDIGGILELLQPLEAEGILVRRSRELLETEIEYFTIIERDGMIMACAALYPFPEDRVAELACLAVHADYRNEGRGEELLKYTERMASSAGIERLFVLTTRTAHWFVERGFVEGSIEDLPVRRQAMYNYQRRSKVFVKPLTASRG